MKYVPLFIILLFVCTGSVNHIKAGEADTFTVIVNSSYPNSDILKKDLSNIFLKKKTRWEQSGEFIYPADLFGDSPIRIIFSHLVHGKRMSAIRAYWQQQIFSGRKIPPIEKNTDEDVLHYVQQKPGAIGYVSETTDISQYRVKAIEVIGE